MQVLFKQNVEILIIFKVSDFTLTSNLTVTVNKSSITFSHQNFHWQEVETPNKCIQVTPEAHLMQALHALTITGRES